MQRFTGMVLALLALSIITSYAALLAFNGGRVVLGSIFVLVDLALFADILRRISRGQKEGKCR